MLIEHITLGGDTAFRDTKAIKSQTIKHFEKFQFNNDTRKIAVEKTPFIVKATAMPEGAYFDILIGEQVLFYNLCCFEDEKKIELIETIFHIHENTGFGEPRLPVSDTWIYTVPIDGLGIDTMWLQIAGEIELYIYYALYLGNLNRL